MTPDPDPADHSPDENEPAAFPAEAGEPIENKQEGAREWIAISLLLILAGIILALFCSLWAGLLKASDFRELAAVLIAPIIGLIGSVIGFYFGTKSGSSGGS